MYVSSAMTPVSLVVVAETTKTFFLYSECAQKITGNSYSVG